MKALVWVSYHEQVELEPVYEITVSKRYVTASFNDAFIILYSQFTWLAPMRYFVFWHCSLRYGTSLSKPLDLSMHKETLLLLVGSRGKTIGKQFSVSSLGPYAIMTAPVNATTYSYFQKPNINRLTLMYLFASPRNTGVFFSNLYHEMYKLKVTLM